jgi:hypothetical protein
MGREIPVNEARATRRLKARGGLEGKVEGFPQREDLAFGQQVRQRFAAQLLEDYIDRPILQLADFIDRGNVRMLNLRRPAELLLCGGHSSDGLGAQDQQRNLNPGRILRMVERAFGSRAQSVEDPQATREDPADRDKVSGTTLIVRLARGRLKGRVSSGEIAVYHLQF